MDYTPLQGKSQPFDSDEDMMLMVREVLTEQSIVEARSARLERAERLRDIKIAEAAIADEDEEETPAPKAWSRLRWPLTLGLFAAVCVLKPFWVLGAIFVVLVAVVGTFMIFGAEGVWTSVVKWLRRVDERDPERASAWRMWLDKLAYRWDTVLDMLPEHKVDHLYMPDFQSIEQQRN